MRGYSIKDEDLKQELERHLETALVDRGLISLWSDSRIMPGSNWRKELETNLNAARIILFLISPNFLASDWTESELRQALKLYESEQAVVIPIILRPADWFKSPLKDFQALPTHGTPITEWSDRNEAYRDIVSGIQKVVEAMLARKPSSSSSSAHVTSDEEKQLQSINGKPLSTTPDSNDTISSDPNSEQDEIALFRRLSPSSRQALNNADGMRVALGSQKIHMEHLIAALLAEKGGPTEELLKKANIDLTTLSTVVGTSFPPVGSYSPSELDALPQISDHVRNALIAARNIVGLQDDNPVRTRHLLYGALSVANCHVIEALVARGVHKEDIHISILPSGNLVSLRPVISGFASDDPDDPNSEDMLGIKKEVEVLCSVLAAKDINPPLSLGLFGNWGSGKSFFMRMMRKRIEKLKEAALRTEGETAYCKDIVQLTFNAWHYIDTDLWASLTSEIFDGLARALVKKDDTDSEYKRAHLMASIIKSKDKLALAEQEKDEADAHLRESQHRLNQLEKDEAAIEINLTPQAILQGALRVAIRQPEVDEAIDETKQVLNNKMKEAAEELNYPPTDAMKAELKTQLLELQGIGGMVQAFVIAIRNAGDRRAWLGLIAGVIFIILTFVLAPILLFFYRAYVVGALSSIAGLLLAIILSLSPFIRSVQRALNLIKEAQEKYVQLIKEERQRKQTELQPRHKELQGEVNKAQKSLENAQKRLKEASNEVKNNVQEMEALRADRQMADFIKQRQASTIYTKHLGVIAQAHEDFKKLSTLLAKEKLVSQEEQLLPRIDRIILYIDDLDRCPEHQVVEVLQAVHLLLAFPLFVVVVGVDSRWLLHSLKQHSKVFQGEANERDGIGDEEQTHWQTTPLNYLEKIFQIPFALRPMNAPGFELLVDDLTSKKKSTYQDEKKSEQVTDKNMGDKRDDNSNLNRSIAAETSELHPKLPPSDIANGALAPDVNILHHEDIDLNPQYLQIEDWERAIMKKLYRFIPSPRSVKRFINVYRLLRASIDDEKLQAFIGDENGGQHRSMLLLLAMFIGYPVETTQILHILVEQKHTETWWEFIDSFKSRAEFPNLPVNSTVQNNVSEVETEHWKQLLDKLAEVRSLISENHSCEDFVECAPQVARYSYQAGSVLFA